MSEYTPTTKDVREVWIYAQDITHDEGEDFHGAEFDRWRAAHDAEKDRLAEAVQAAYNALHMETRERAIAILHDALSGVVAEEPEWEYARQAEANGWTGPAVYRDEAHASDGLMPGWRVVRRRKAGPWVPLEN